MLCRQFSCLLVEAPYQSYDFDKNRQTRTQGVCIVFNLLWIQILFVVGVRIPFSVVFRVFTRYSLMLDCLSKSLADFVERFYCFVRDTLICSAFARANLFFSSDWK